MRQLRLFHVQDADRPAYVVATDWQHALSAWQEMVRDEDGEPRPHAHEYDPDGIALVCDDTELIVDMQEATMPEQTAEQLRRIVLGLWCYDCNAPASPECPNDADHSGCPALWTRWPACRRTAQSGRHLTWIPQYGWRWMGTPEPGHEFGDHGPCEDPESAIAWGIVSAARGEGMNVHFEFDLACVEGRKSKVHVGHGPDDLTRLVAAAHLYRDSVEASDE